MAFEQQQNSSNRYITLFIYVVIHVGWRGRRGWDCVVGSVMEGLGLSRRMRVDGEREIVGGGQLANPGFPVKTVCVYVCCYTCCTLFFVSCNILAIARNNSLSVLKAIFQVNLG